MPSIWRLAWWWAVTGSWGWSHDEKNKYDNYCKIILDTTYNTKFQIPPTKKKTYSRIIIHMDMFKKQLQIPHISKKLQINKRELWWSGPLAALATRHLTGDTWKRSRTITSSGGSDWLFVVFWVMGPMGVIWGHDWWCPNSLRGVFLAKLFEFFWKYRWIFPTKRKNIGLATSVDLCRYHHRTGDMDSRKIHAEHQNG